MADSKEDGNIEVASPSMTEGVITSLSIDALGVVQYTAQRGTRQFAGSVPKEMRVGHLATIIKICSGGSVQDGVPREARCEEGQLHILSMGDRRLVASLRPLQVGAIPADRHVLQHGAIPYIKVYKGLCDHQEHQRNVGQEGEIVDLDHKTGAFQIAMGCHPDNYEWFTMINRFVREFLDSEETSIPPDSKEIIDSYIKQITS